MHKLHQDLRFGLRQMAKAPGFALAAVLTIGLGIGATTSIFSVVNNVLLRPLPFPEPDRLVAVGSWNDRLSHATNSVGAMSYPDFFDWRAQNHSFSGLAAYHDNTLTLTGAGEPRHLNAQIVTGDFFEVLGVAPAIGRGILKEDEKPRTYVAVLSHELWRTTFGSAQDVVGRAIALDNKSYTVVGVMPKGFEFPIQTPAPQLWTSIADDGYDANGQPATAQRGAHMLDVVARLRPGVSVEQANADVTVLARNLSRQFPKTNAHFTAGKVVPQLEVLVGDARSALQMLFAAVALMLLVACANVAGLLLARASRRRPEMAVRAALGATRAQIFRQLLIESVLLSVAGGVIGLALSKLLLRIVVQLLPADLPRAASVSLSGTVLAFAVAVSVATGLLFGLLPAWRTSRVDPSSALRDGTRTATTGRGQHRLHNTLVIAETAVGLVLLVSSGLLIRSFVRVLQVDPGFDQRKVLTASLALPDSRYQRQQQIDFYEQLLPGLRALPGVVSASAGWPLPLSSDGMRITFDIEGRPLPEGEQNSARVSIAEPGYFRTLRIPLLRGREFLESDTTKSNPVVVVNQAFVNAFFPGEYPIGKHINPGLGDGALTDVPREIVGIVANVKAARLTEEVAPEYYLPFSQAVVTSPRLIIRTAVDPAGLIPAVRAQVAQLDKNLPLFEVRTMDDVVSHSAAQHRFQALLLSCFAAVSLLLCAIGLYGLLSYLVAQRALEIGVRMALGAQRKSVLAMIVRRGMMLAGIGLIVGVCGSLMATRFLKGLLFGVHPLDAPTFLAVSAILLLVCLLASSLPAYRAATLDPVKTLHDQ